MEIDNDINRENVKTLVRELMEGEKGKKMKKQAMEWKKLAEEATAPNGTSSMNLDKLINEVFLFIFNVLKIFLKKLIFYFIFFSCFKFIFF
jgi:hypothetical protein